MNRIIICSFSFLLVLAMAPAKSEAQDITGITGIITSAVTKVIKAFDLEVQRIQNKTVWLQEAQKTLENAMQQLHLDEITDWVQKQKDLYAEYFDELWKVKTIISYYYRIKEITDKQLQLVNAYGQAWQLLRNDKHFTADEIQHMQAVYSGIISESLKNIDALLVVINSFSTQMSDADRLQLINHAADNVDRDYTNLMRFNNQNKMLSLQRARTQDDIDMVKKLYGLQ